MSVKVHMPNREVELEEAYELIKIPNGYIKKFTDGTAEYHEAIYLDKIDITTPAGTLFYNGIPKNLGNFKNFNFKSTPQVSMEHQITRYNFIICGFRNASTSSLGEIIFARENDATGADCIIHYHAYGFWK